MLYFATHLDILNLNNLFLNLSCFLKEENQLIKCNMPPLVTKDAAAIFLLNLDPSPTLLPKGALLGFCTQTGHVEGHCLSVKL